MTIHGHDPTTNHGNSCIQTYMETLYTNIRGIKGKKSSLIEQLDSENRGFHTEVFILTETLLPVNMNIQITGYTFPDTVKKAEELECW